MMPLARSSRRPWLDYDQAASSYVYELQIHRWPPSPSGSDGGNGSEGLLRRVSGYRCLLFLSCDRDATEMRHSQSAEFLL